MKKEKEPSLFTIICFLFLLFFAGAFADGRRKGEIWFNNHMKKKKNKASSKIPS